MGRSHSYIFSQGKFSTDSVLTLLSGSETGACPLPGELIARIPATSVATAP